MNSSNNTRKSLIIKKKIERIQGIKEEHKTYSKITNNTRKRLIKLNLKL